MLPALSNHSRCLVSGLARSPQLSCPLQQRRSSHLHAGSLTASCRPCGVRVLAHGSGGAAVAEQSGHGSGRRLRPGEKKGFVEEMRMVAMKLHTKDQAPKEGGKEGGKEAAPKPFPKWEPSREGYLKFLAESKEMFQTLEDIVDAAPHPDYAKFQNTGLERSTPLAQDIRWFRDTYGLEAPQPAADGPGREYSQLLQRLAEEDPPSFICHFYNIYFAHSAGGRMIGKKVSSMVLDGAELIFYKYDGAELSELLDKVRDNINKVAETWSNEEKQRCLTETEQSFKYSGAVLRSITA